MQRVNGKEKNDQQLASVENLEDRIVKLNKKYVLTIVNIVVLVGIIFFVKNSYAYLYQTLQGNKTYSLKVKGFELKLDDSSTLENIKIEEATPVSDEIGKQSTAYTFSIINEDPTETGYILYLDDVEIDDEINRMKDSNIKYQLIENGKDKLGLVSELGTHPFRILTSGVISGNTTNNYSLRFWIKEEAEVSTNQVFNVKIRVIATSKEAIEEGKLVFGETIVTSDSGVTSMTSDQLQSYVDKALENRLVQKESEILDKNHPVGSIYISEINQNPSEIFGGVWEVYAGGRTLVGVGNNGEKNYLQSNLTGGKCGVSLTKSQIPSLDIAGKTNIAGSHNHKYNLSWTNNDSYASLSPGGSFPTHTSPTYVATQVTLFGGEHSHTVTASYTNTNQIKVDILNPYITVYMWKRVG